MLLSPHEAELFFKLYSSLMFYANRDLEVVPNLASAEQFPSFPPKTRLEVRKALLEHPNLIESFAIENPAGLSEEELLIVRSWQQDRVSGRFFAFRQLKNHMIFLTANDPPTAYGVVALTEPFENLIGPYLPVMTETLLLPFKGKIIYDGLLTSFNITFGGGIKRSLNESYKDAKEQLGIVTSLPIESLPISTRKTAAKQTPKKTKRPASNDVKSVLDSIIGMTDAFCREHLNDEYAELCRKLAEKLSRKRPSPLVRGKIETWASGIIRTIGWVNFLDDRTTEPHMKLTAIDKAFGVGESTGQGKSLEIRKLLKIRRFDMDWTLPSRMDDNLMGWMLEVNGFVMDVRKAPREVQEIAYKKGLIPYIPADR